MSDVGCQVSELLAGPPLQLWVKSNNFTPGQTPIPNPCVTPDPKANTETSQDQPESIECKVELPNVEESEQETVEPVEQSPEKPTILRKRRRKQVFILPTSQDHLELPNGTAELRSGDESRLRRELPAERRRKWGKFIRQKGRLQQLMSANANMATPANQPKIPDGKVKVSNRKKSGQETGDRKERASKKLEISKKRQRNQIETELYRCRECRELFSEPSSLRDHFAEEHKRPVIQEGGKPVRKATALFETVFNCLACRATMELDPDTIKRYFFFNAKNECNLNRVLLIFF